MKNSSILNDVLGPVMTGPSSSHTAGPGKIGLSVHRLFGKEIAKAVVCYDKDGSYPKTHVGQGCDFGFAAGIIGYEPDDPNFRYSIENAKKAGVDIVFEVGPVGAHHPNEARVTVTGRDGSTMIVRGYSTGGGTFLIPEIDGYEVDFDGQRKKYYICVKNADFADFEASLKSMHAVYALRKKEGCSDVLFEIEAASLKDNTLDEAVIPSGAVFVRCAGPIAPLALRLTPQTPFATAEGALKYAEEKGITSMGELGLLYEESLASVSREVIEKAMKRVMNTMRVSMTPPPVDDEVKPKMIDLVAEKLKAKAIPIDMGLLNVCLAASIAVMENNCCHRSMVAAPTAGSAGIIPATIIALGEKLGKSDDQILEALWASGLVGSFIANQATFAAEVAGCQAEIGSAACMAAAGVVQLMGGTIQQGFAAAEIAMQSLLGLVCDPVGGLVEFPCIERNATASAMVIMAANMALMGMTTLIPLDETIQCMGNIGDILPSELRCTCNGGLCTTCSGLNWMDKVNKMNQIK